MMTKLNDALNKNVNNRFKNIMEMPILAENVSILLQQNENDMKVVYTFLKMQSEHRHRQYIPLISATHVPVSSLSL